MSGPARFKNHVKISERHGAGEWLSEKVALALLMPLGLWVLVSAWTLMGTGYDGAVAWFANRANAALSALTLLVFLWFSALAWKVIVEDYIHGKAQQRLIGLVNVICVLLAVVGVFFIVRLALGSAPLPAGMGA